VVGRLVLLQLLLRRPVWGCTLMRSTSYLCSRGKLAASCLFPGQTYSAALCEQRNLRQSALLAALAAASNCATTCGTCHCHSSTLLPCMAKCQNVFKCVAMCCFHCALRARASRAWCTSRRWVTLAAASIPKLHPVSVSAPCVQVQAERGAHRVAG
jgi:hypothetical protein